MGADARRGELAPPSDVPTLAAVGVLSGLMSGLFGVGGGVITVPLLVLWLSYDQRVATGTSLAVIVVAALVGSLTQNAYGNVDFGNAALVGIPALAGVLFGTWLQQRIATRWIGLAFSVLLVATAIQLNV